MRYFFYQPPVYFLFKMLVGAMYVLQDLWFLEVVSICLVRNKDVLDQPSLEEGNHVSVNAGDTADIIEESIVGGLVGVRIRISNLTKGILLSLEVQDNVVLELIELGSAAHVGLEFRDHAEEVLVLLIELGRFDVEALAPDKR